MTSYQAPTLAQVSEALRRIPTSQLRRAFYEGLKNPLWLEPLRAAGAFRDPPSRVTMDDGSSGDPYWPEIEYVVNVAEDVPASAIDVLVDLKDTDNAWVRRALFAVGAVVPAREAARLKPVLKEWISTGFGWRSDPREMVAFAINLLEGGERKTGEWVANALFRPGSREGSREPELVLEEYWYEGGLPRVVSALGPTGLPLVLGWLIEYERATGKLDGWFYRPRVGDRHDRHHDVGHALIDAVRDLSIQAIVSDPAGTIDLLLRTERFLTRRLAMYAAMTALVEAPVGSAGELVESAVRLLCDRLSADERCRIEFGELAREVARHDPSALTPLTDFISEGPTQDADELRQRLRRDGDETDADLDARVAAYIEHWQHKWLATVGADALPESLVTLLIALDARLGEIDDPLRPPFLITSWTGPNSALTLDEMSAMSGQELVTHLESWHDDGDGWGPEPSHEGQAREVTTLVASSPLFFAGVGSLVFRLRPTYLRAIMQGWSAAFNANLGLDWTQVAETIADVLAHGDELDFPREGGDMDDDEDFNWAKRAAVALSVELVKRADRAVPPAIVERLAELLVAEAGDIAAWTAYAADERDSGTDPLTLSLNERWPVLLRALAILVGYGPAVPWSDAARRALLTELERPDPRGAAHAVVGENLARMLNADKTWTEERVVAWFGGMPDITTGQQIALSTAIAIHQYHRTLYRLLTPSMLAALALPGPIAEGWQHHGSSPVAQIGEWAVKAMIFGDVDSNDPVVTEFFSSVEPAERGAALGHVAWEFMHASEVAEDIRGRFADVWDARFAHVEELNSDAEELSEFYWVVRSGKFDAKWWLPRLKRALELGPELASHRYMIGSDLAQAAAFDPRAAFDIVRLLVDTMHTEGIGVLDLSRNALPIVLARAIDSEDAQLKSEATIFMNELGERGQRDLARQVDAVRNGAITEEDLDRD